jgi:hypothetical protein
MQTLRANCAQCLGLIGAVDPSRLPEVSQTPSAIANSSQMFVPAQAETGSVKPIACQLIKLLVKQMRAAQERERRTNVVDRFVTSVDVGVSLIKYLIFFFIYHYRIAFTLQKLLQLCGCDYETVSRMDSNTAGKSRAMPLLFSIIIFLKKI